MNELSEEELGGLEGQPDPLYSYAILRRAAAEIRRLRAALAERDAMLAKATRDVFAERERQKAVEGWTPEHDDQHSYGEMATAAACYAAPFSLFQSHVFAHDVQGGHRESKAFVQYRPAWPWAHHWWKPKDRRRDLVRAGALILAEIERLDRAASLASELKEKQP